MSIYEAIILGVVQGLTEFLPVSSSGHLILVREVLGLGLGGGGLAFDAILHFATALAVALYFWKDIFMLFQSAFLWVTQNEIEETQKRLIVALVVATIPAVILGLLLEDIMASVFRNGALVAVTLVLGSIIMIVAEKLSKGGFWTEGETQREPLDTKGAVVVGLFQSLALVPGMSRSGMAISGGMLMGLSREMAARFAFLLAVPLLLGAGAKKMLDLSASGELMNGLMPLLIGAMSAFVVGILVIHYLLKYLRTHSLMVFVWYRLALAAVILVVMVVV